MNKEQLDAISDALVYIIKSMPNYEPYSDYGTPEGAFIVNQLLQAKGETDDY